MLDVYNVNDVDVWPHNIIIMGLAVSGFYKLNIDVKLQRYMYRYTTAK
jgi:hypothetical protein